MVTIGEGTRRRRVPAGALAVGFVSRESGMVLTPGRHNALVAEWIAYAQVMSPGLVASPESVTQSLDEKGGLAAFMLSLPCLFEQVPDDCLRLSSVEAVTQDAVAFATEQGNPALSQTYMSSARNTLVLSLDDLPEGSSLSLRSWSRSKPRCA